VIKTLKDKNINKSLCKLTIHQAYDKIFNRV